MPSFHLLVGNIDGESSDVDDVVCVGVSVVANRGRIGNVRDRGESVRVGTYKPLQVSIMSK